jgi:outer membrane protein TolC
MAAALAPPDVAAQQPSVPNVAPGYTAPTSEPSAPAIAGVVERPFVGISLQDAIAMALVRNPQLAVSASNVRIARFNVVEARGPFDVQLHLQPSSSYSVQPPGNLFFAGPGLGGIYTCQQFFHEYPCDVVGPGNIVQHQYQFQGGFAGQTVNGASWSAGIVRTRTINNEIINTYNPGYQSTLNLQLTQPLLRNFGINAAKRQLNLSLVVADAGAAQALVDASNTIAQVEDTYWDLVAAWRNVAIQEDAVRQATDQQRSTVRLARAGAAPPVTAVESQTQVSAFQNNVVVALQNVAELQNKLKSLLVTDANDPIWLANLVPSSPVEQLPTAGDLPSVVTQALHSRPEVRIAEDQGTEARIDHAYARNQALPQADLQIGLMSNGFAGALAPIPGFEQVECSGSPIGVCPTPPPDTIGKMGQATSNMWSFKFPAFNVALVVNFPLRNEFARGLEGSASQEQQQAAIAMQSVQERIVVESRLALQGYQTALSQLYAARHSREAAEAVYASEVRQFHAGASTTFLVLQRQVELAQARGAELQAQTNLNKSVVELQRVDGTILSANGVRLESLGTKALP